MHIRRIDAEERVNTTFPLKGYAFENHRHRAAEEKFQEYVPHHEGNRTLAVDDEGTILAAATAIPMRQNVRGSTYPMGHPATPAD